MYPNLLRSAIWISSTISLQDEVLTFIVVSSDLLGVKILCYAVSAVIYPQMLTIYFSDEKLSIFSFLKKTVM